MKEKWEMHLIQSLFHTRTSYFSYEEGNICVQYKLSPRYIKSFIWHKYIILPKKGKNGQGERQDEELLNFLHFILFQDSRVTSVIFRVPIPEHRKAGM